MSSRQEAAKRTLELDEEQVLWFRARRGHVAGPGAPNVRAAARSILGAQSQQLGPSLLALSARTKGRPSAEEIQKHLFSTPRSLVRIWGQRDTLFVYEARTHWADVVAARRRWVGGRRRFGNPPARLAQKARKRLVSASEPLKRSDFLELAPERLVDDWKKRMKVDDATARRFAAGRLFWKLAHEGEACLAEKAGAEQGYAAREHWFPDLEWPAKLDPDAAATRLVRDYLATFGPGTPRDVGHFFGARLEDVGGWLEELDLVRVACGDRDDLVALAKDARTLKVRPPKRASEWPVRLLPLWDAALMAHRDKRWLTPEVADEKRVWRKSAVVAATVVARGRVVANWKHSIARQRLEVEVEPLSAWKASYLPSVKREAKAVARHLGVTAGEVAVSG